MKKILLFTALALLAILTITIPIHVNAFCNGYCAAWAGTGHWGTWGTGYTWATGSAWTSSANFVGADLWAYARIGRNAWTTDIEHDVDGYVAVIADQFGPYGLFAQSSAGVSGSYLHNAGQPDEWLERGLWDEDGSDISAKNE